MLKRLLLGLLAILVSISLAVAVNTYRRGTRQIDVRPVGATDADLSRFHGTNERISIDNYAEMIAFYHRLIMRASQSGQP